MSTTVLIDALSEVRRRVRTLSVAYGVGVVLAAAVGLLVGTVLLDYLLNLPAVPRVLLVLVSLGGLGHLLAQRVVRPALAKVGLGDIAGRLEHVFPEFDDRLRSTVEFVGRGTPGSDAMKDRVISETTSMVGRVDLTRAVEATPVWYSSAGAAGAVAALVLLAVLIGPDYLGSALARLLLPFGSHPWPKRVEIEMLGDVPTRVPVGGHVDLRLRLAKGDRPSREARVFYKFGDGRVDQELMTRGADGTYSASLDARAVAASAVAGVATAGVAPMDVWVTAGDDEQHLPPIAVVERLAVRRVELTCAPPAYAGDPPTTVDLGAQPATVTFGSTLSLRAAFNKPLDPRRAVSLSPADARNGPPPAAAQWTLDGASAKAVFPAVSTFRFQIHATDVDGFANPGLEEYQVVVRPDQLPSVQITKPTRNEECTPDAVLPVRGVAEDDFGIASVQLVAVRVADKKQLAAIDLVTDGKAAADGVGFARLDQAGERRRWQIDFDWNLAKLDGGAPLKPGDVVEYSLRVTDNFRLDGQTHPPVESGKLRVTILSQDQFTALMNDLLHQVRDAVADVAKSQGRTKSETNDLRQDTAGKPAMDKADRDVAQRLTNQQSTAAAQAKAAAVKLDDLVSRMAENRSAATELKEMAASVRDDLASAAEHPMKDAANQIDQAKDVKADPSAKPDEQKKQADARDAQLDAAGANQQQAMDALQRALDKMGTVGGLQPMIDKVNALLKAQQDLSARLQEVGKTELGKTREQMDPAQRDALDKVAAEQADLSKKADKAMSDLDDAAKKMEKSDQPTAKSMSEAAETGRQQNVASNMKTASEQAGQNQQAGAQSKQKQVEIGLQMVLSQLKEAQRRNLEQLAKKLEDLQKQVAELILQQAGHNLDNLGLQGAEAVARVDAKALDELFALAGRDRAKPPAPPELPGQTSLQEQTERNARNIAHVADALPDGAEPAAQLSRAAEKMGRAITALRDDSVAQPARLAAALEPPQTEALAALRAAKRIVDEQKAKAEDAIKQQQKDAIRKVFEQILADQKKLDADTLDVDKAKGPDGALPRPQLIRLAQLPPAQGKLAKQTGDLSDDLEAVGGIVYVWAVKDIVSTMSEVKADLAKPETGPPTRTEQARIEKQLAAMIKDLATHPKRSEFASKGGGGGGPPPPKLPPEAELRLLKDLQAAVNDATASLDRQTPHDNPKLLALGNRQGELRSLLDQVLKKSSSGKVGLGPEPDNKDQLPEEANAADVDQQELEQDLLQGKPAGAEDIKKDTNLIGARMARSRQRLALSTDPGKVTQEIQKRVLADLDDLIEMSRQQQGEQQNPDKKNGPKKPSNAQDPTVAQGKQPNNGNVSGPKRGVGGSTPAQTSTGNNDVDASTGTAQNIAELNKEWGGLSPRQRAAITEAATEKPLEKFKTFIDDYYKSLATKATEH